MTTRTFRCGPQPSRTPLET
ncbi:MAG: hypothetical protein IPK13_05250 [Deltaproteobacteria bacterium]|nr:hypothetical protein [Deltaproteobacteria bacterium]